MNTNDVSTQFDPNSHLNNNYVINNQNGPFVKVTLLDEQPLYCPRILAEVFTIENFDLCGRRPLRDQNLEVCRFADGYRLTGTQIIAIDSNQISRCVLVWSLTAQVEKKKPMGPGAHGRERRMVRLS